VHFRHRCSSSTSPCGSVAGGTAFVFVFQFPPLCLTIARIILVSFCHGLAYIDTRAWPRQRQATVAPLSLSFSCSCAFDSRPTDRRQPTCHRSPFCFVTRTFPFFRRLVTFVDRLSSRYHLKCTRNSRRASRIFGIEASALLSLILPDFEQTWSNRPRLSG
jgi:hypothetical protein